MWTHGGATVDASDDLSRGSAAWRDSYVSQGEQKRAQIEAMIRYAQSSQCRMSSLVRHFGDTADSQKPCGICDFCAPDKCVAQRFRPANEMEETLARRVLDALRGSGRSLGKLHTELCAENGMDRDSFEELMGAMARAGLVRMADAVFEKDGKQIPFRKASLGRDADFVDDDGPLGLQIRGAPLTAPRKKAAAGRKKKAARRGGPAKARTERKAPASDESPVVALLKEWRRTQAKKQGVPTFRIMSDRVLLAIAEDQPATLAELLAIPGIGLKTVEKYGAQIYKILNQARG